MPSPRPFLLAAFLALLCVAPAPAADPLEAGFADPPPSARLRAYWWWLNGNVTKEAITTDLEGMKTQGFGGAILCDADGSAQDGNARAPHGPTFFSPAWRELYKHALREADRLGLEISLNIQSGWNLGGPSVKAEDAPKKLVWSETVVPAGQPAPALPEPKHPPAFYRDVAVLAFPTPTGKSGGLKNLAFKALQKPLGMSAPDTHLLFDESPAQPTDENISPGSVLDLTGQLRPDGTLAWTAPASATGWTVLRFGCTLNDHCRVSTNSEGWDGYALDPYDEPPFRAYWEAVVAPLIADAGPLAGKTLRYLHTDSWEVETANWTPTLREEFRARRGYDLRAYLPVIAGHIVGSRDVSDRFLEDLRRTLGDLAIDHHYKPFRDLAHQHGLEIHPESGGPHASPFDAQQCLGFSDAPMSEFWAKSPRHRTTDAERFFVKQPASAAHTYGKKLVLAEGFTTIGTHWQESLAENLKPSFDQAICEGLNRLVWHAFVCSPKETGTPGQQYFAGTHLDPKSTWFQRSGAFLKYLNRCQFMMQQGLPVADVLYYYGDHVPNFAQLRASDPAKVGAGYDYDVATAEVLLTRANVKDGRIVLPDGMSYALLALPDYPAMNLPVLRKIRDLVNAGATVVGPRPRRASGLTNYPASDAEVTRIADELWGTGDPLPEGRKVGQGRLFAGKTAGEVLRELSIPGDFASGEVTATLDVPSTEIRFAHRRERDTDIFFVANGKASPSDAWLTFRVVDRAEEARPGGNGLKSAEQWDPVTGNRQNVGIAYGGGKGWTGMILAKLEPYQACFFVFRDGVPDAKTPSGPPTVTSPPLLGLSDDWKVRFDPKWGGPATVDFDTLTDWTKRPEPGIRNYSGTATYAKSFDVPRRVAAPGQRVFLDLGDLHELADVRLNGRSLGNVWTRPFRVEITGAVQPTNNRLEIDVTNFWANRVIGDADLPEAQRLTRTNIRRLNGKTPLSPAGLLGPVQVLVGR